MQRNLIINLLLILIVIIFAVQNYEVIPIKLFFWTVEVSKAFLVILVLLIGVLLGIFTSTASAYRRKKMKEKASETKAKPDTKQEE